MTHTPLPPRADPDRACDHPDFAAFVEVGRLTDGDDGPVTGYMAEIRVHCLACDEPMIWIGTPVGYSPREPSCSVDGKELRVPLRPESAPLDFGLSGPAFRIRAHRDDGDDGERRKNFQTPDPREGPTDV